MLNKKKPNRSPLVHVERSKYAQLMRTLSEDTLDELDVAIHLLHKKSTPSGFKAELAEEMLRSVK